MSPALTLENALLAAVALAVAVGLALMLLGGLRGVAVRWRERQLTRQVTALRGRLEEHAAGGFQDVERLFVELRAVDDPQQTDAVLRDVGDFAALDDGARRRLRELYDRLGLLTLHRVNLREASDWRSRADAALVLGSLAVLDAIPLLVEAIRDPDEDASTVKAAAARALGMMTAPGAPELLVAELAQPGDWSAPRIAEVLVEMGSQAVSACLAGLEHESANVRAWCCRVLGRVGAGEAVAALRRRLMDRSGPVRTVAAEALGLLGDPAATSGLAEVLGRDPAAQVRAAAARALGAIRDPASASALIEALADPDPWTRTCAVEALERLAPADGDALLEVVRSGREEAARAASVALERTGHVGRWVDELRGAPPGRAEALESWLILVARRGGGGPVEAALLTSPDLAVRARAARLLGRTGDPAMTETLARACGDAEWPVRLEALKAWVEVASHDAEPAVLLEALDDGEELVRVAALEGLVLRGGMSHVPPERLPALAGQANLEARVAALEGVRGTASERAVAMLLRQDPSAALRATAVAALGRVAEGVGDDAFTALLEALADRDERVRAAAAAALGGFAAPEATDALVRATFDAGPALREEITEVLADRGLDALWDALDAFMASDKEEARLAVLWTLGKMGDPRGVPLLRAALADPRPRVRSSAVGALGKISGPETAHALLDALADPDGRTRAAAVNALGRSGGADVVEGLRGALDDPDAFVRGRACVALGRLGDAECRGRIAEEGGRAAVVGLALLGEADDAALLGGLLDGGLGELDGALADEDRDVAARVRAFVGMPEAGTAREDWLEQLRATLAGNRDPDRRLRALELLAGLGDGDAPLGAVVGGDPDPRVRRRAVALLAERGGVGDPGLLRGLKDPDPAVRRAALAAGAKLGAGAGSSVLACADVDLTATVDALVALFRRTPVQLADLLMGASLDWERRAAVAALGRIGARDVAPLLVALLDDPSAGVRASVVEALAALGDDEALTQAATDPSPEVRTAALRGLVSAGAFGAVRQAMTSEPVVAVRVALCEALADADGGAVLEVALDDAHPSVRKAALLGCLGAGSYSAFCGGLTRLDPVEAEVVRGEVGRRGLGDALRRGLDGAAPVRASALAAMTAVDPVGFEAELLRGAEDPDAGVRVAAVDGLARCGSVAARNAVLRAARDADEGVAGRARAAVAGS